MAGVSLPGTEGISLPFGGERGTEGARGPPTCREMPKRTDLGRYAALQRVVRSDPNRDPC